MAKRILLTACITILFSFILFIIFGILEKVASKKEVLAKIQVLPTKIQLMNLDSTLFSFRVNTNTVLIFFNSECEYCHDELRGIEKSVNDFEGIEVVFISSEQISSIKSVPLKYNVSSQKNIHFVKINPEEIYDNFGVMSVPHIFIYDADGKLRKEFNGKTKIETILTYAR